MQNKQRGIALITVLLIMAVIIIIVATMTTQQSVDIRRTANLRDRGQAYTYALGGELLAKQYIQADPMKNIAYVGGFDVPPYPVDNGSISGGFQDQNGCFNVNNLVKNGVDSQADIQRFILLLKALDLDPGLASAVVDWIDADNQVYYPGGAESDYYARLTPPYAIANQPLVSASELAAIKGMTPKVMAKLLPEVCALPKRTKININTADAVVLMTLAPGMTQDIAKNIISARTQANLPKLKSANPIEPSDVGHFKSLNEMYSAVPALSALIPESQITAAFDVSSNFFLVKSVGTFNNSDVVLYSLLERSGNTITSYYRAQGSY